MSTQQTYSGQAYSKNPPAFPLQQRGPTRIVASEYNLAAGDTVSIVGSNNRQDRLQIVITNMDPVVWLDLQILSPPGATGITWGAAFAQRPITFETPFDMQIYNPNGSTVTVRIAEFYPDQGGQHGLAGRRSGRPQTGGG